MDFSATNTMSDLEPMCKGQDSPRSNHRLSGPAGGAFSLMLMYFGCKARTWVQGSSLYSV